MAKIIYTNLYLFRYLPVSSIICWLIVIPILQYHAATPVLCLAFRWYSTSLLVVAWIALWQKHPWLIFLPSCVMPCKHLEPSLENKSSTVISKQQIVKRTNKWTQSIILNFYHSKFLSKFISVRYSKMILSKANWKSFKTLEIGDGNA